MTLTDKINRRSIFLSLCLLSLCLLFFFSSQFIGINTEEAENTNSANVETTATFPQLFTGSICGRYGTAGCIEKGKTCNANWHSYFTTTSTSITMTAGNDCRTVNTHDACRFTVGDNGLTQISFDFNVSNACHGTSGTEWLAFWMYRDPWQATAEVDFIESEFGPGTGLNSNFSGTGKQVVIFDGSTSAPWSGSITATFSGTGTAVSARVTNSHNSNVATTILVQSDGYYFVMDTATGSNSNSCTINVSNLKVKGTISTPSSNCIGLIVQ